MTWPEEFGGRGLTHLDTALVEDVLGYHWLPLSLYLLSYKTIGCALERYATTELKERLLGPIARGELTFCQGFSEPGAGSDLASLTTRAARRGDAWVIDGHKIWTSSAWLADWIYLAVRTNPDEPRHRGISVLVAPLETPGIEVRRFPVVGGGYLCEVFLDGVEIPTENLVGEVDRGWDVLMHTLDFERITAEKLGGPRVGPRRARGAARRDRPARAPPGTGSRVCGASSPRRACCRCARRISSTAAPTRARPPRWPSSGAHASLSASRGRGSSSSDSRGSQTAHPSSPLEGRIGGLYRASVGSTISGGSAEILQVVIARRGLALR